MATAILEMNVGALRTSGFPVYSLNRDEKRQQLLTLLEYDHTQVIQNGVVGQTMHGLSLAWHYQPHAWGVRCGKMLTPIEVFGNDALLHDALVRREKLGSCRTENDLRKTLRGYSGTQGVSNFRPVAMAAICDRYLPSSGGTVWDMSAGYGGRLLGALACTRVHRYIGTDPASLTFDGLCEMSEELLPAMRLMGFHPPIVQLYKMGSEDFVPEPESLSLCCTSPPYGQHEKYSSEASQSYIRFPTNGLWMNDFMRMTLENCRIGLKQDGFLVMNLADTKGYPTLTKDFLSLAKDTGFTMVETLQLALSKMVGTDKKLASHKYEPVFVFTKRP